MEKRNTRSWECLVSEIEACWLRWNMNTSKGQILSSIIGIIPKPMFLQEILFEDRVPKTKKVTCFYSNEVDDLVARMAELSLTHRVMHVTGSSIYVTESEDHQTNIDADLIDAITRVF